MFLKGHYPHNFERAAKSVTCVQIESIQIDGFKNVKKKKIKMVPRCHGNQPLSPKQKMPSRWPKYLKFEK